MGGGRRRNSLRKRLVRKPRWKEASWEREFRIALTDGSPEEGTVHEFRGKVENTITRILKKKASYLSSEKDKLSNTPSSSGMKELNPYMGGSGF
jgi:hypothetical protein